MVMVWAVLWTTIPCQPGKTIDAKRSRAMMRDYLKSSRNPNLKLGKIKDRGNAFEAEILTKKTISVDRVHIDKPGYIRIGLLGID